MSTFRATIALSGTQSDRLNLSTTERVKMSFEFKDKKQVAKDIANRDQQRTDKAWFLFHAIKFCIPLYGVITIILDDYRGSRIYCQSFKQPAIFLLFALLSFIQPAILSASTIFLPLTVVPIFIAYSYAKFRTKFWTAVSNNFH